jgi:hypothetical protein
MLQINLLCGELEQKINEFKGSKRNLSLLSAVVFGNNLTIFICHVYKLSLIAVNNF